MINRSAVEYVRGTGDPGIGPAVAGTGSASAAIVAFHLEPRCRVCRTEEVRRKVNSMLAAGGSYAGIVRSLIADNAKLPDADRVSVDSVRNHAARHFPAQNPAGIAYQEGLELRARQNQLAYLEALLIKSLETLTRDGAAVPVETGLQAASLLRTVLDGQNCDAGNAGILREVELLDRAISRSATTDE
jgi:hypothetical protein